MDARSAKQMALEAVQRLPDDATLEDAMERLYFLHKVERGPGRRGGRTGRAP
jgi:hypothetical protein